LVLTGGGFLLGFGLCLLLVGLLAGFMAVEVFERLERSRCDIEALYNATHSLEYQNDLRALEKLSSAIDRIRNALCNPAISWMGLCGISEELANSINNATNYMRKVQSISEELHSTAIAMPMAVKLLWIATLAGIAMIGAGTALITRARKRRG
jgi:hypothetical protein